ncbi:MAG: insulinase family protein [Bacteroidia bacterium]|nr:insulinase family protein [Bacteroidia bacterium]
MPSLAIDRTKPPILQDVGEINIIEATQVQLNNNIPLYTINAGEQDVLKFEIIFPGGTVHEKQHAVAVATTQLLDEGTEKHSAKEIAELFEYYGASIEKQTTFDGSSLILYTLNKHLGKTLSLFLEIIREANFPEKELSTYVTRRKQQLSINLEKVEFVARRDFMKQLFGSNHPYGYNTTVLDYDNLNTAIIKEHHKNCYALDNCKIIVSGKINSQVTDYINKIFGNDSVLSNVTQPQKSNALDNMSDVTNVLHIAKEGAIQSGIRIGKVLFNKTHKDFIELTVLNTVLGGYFGSRLMSNIREDKGYTYGIGSGLVSYQESGYFFITTQVGVDVCKDALKEIYKEIDILKSELIPEDELDLVKKYMQGAFVRGIDGPFELASTFKSLLLYNLDYSFLHNYLSVIQSVTSDRLRELAQEYFTDLKETVVGLPKAQ